VYIHRMQERKPAAINHIYARGCVLFRKRSYFAAFQQIIAGGLAGNERCVGMVYVIIILCSGVKLLFIK